MAAFSIYTRDADPAEDSLATRPAPDAQSYRIGPHLAKQSLDASPSEMDEPAVPVGIVLRLPDLGESRSNILSYVLGPHMFWIAIGLGALLAIGLIWTGKKPAPRPINEAPSWTSQGPGPVQVDRGAHEGAPPEIRAARRFDPPWDVNASPAQPGVAVPVGTIITGAPE
jgi:hypothetical protein